MGSNEILGKNELINKEFRRLKKIYKEIPSNQKIIADGLLHEAAYMRVQLDLYKQDLDENGYKEMFSQSDKLEPYERERPVARLYTTLNKNYQSIMKQLSDMLHKQPPVNQVPSEGGGGGGQDFESFVASK